MKKAALLAFFASTALSACDRTHQHSTEAPESQSTSPQATTPTPAAPKSTPPTDSSTQRSSKTLEEDEVAFTLGLRHDTSHITPGDRVDIMWTTPDGPPFSTRPAERLEPFRTFAVLHDVRVIGSFDRALELAVPRGDVWLLAATPKVPGAARAFDAYKRPAGDHGLLPYVELGDDEVFEALKLSGRTRCGPGRSSSTRTGLGSLDHSRLAGHEQIMKDIRGAPTTFEQGTRLATIDAPHAHERFEPGQKIGLMLTWNHIGPRWQHIEPNENTRTTKTHVIFRELTIHSTARGSVTFPIHAGAAIGLSSLLSKGHVEVYRGDVEIRFEPTRLEDLADTLQEKLDEHKRRTSEERRRQLGLP